MANKYFKPGTNRSPQQRRLVRKIIEEQYVTGTNQDTTEIDAHEEMSTSLTTGDAGELQEVPNTPQVAAGFFGVGIKSAWGTIVAGVVFAGAVIAVIVFFNSLSNGITENRAKIESTQDIMDRQNENTLSRLDIFQNNLNEKINDLKDRIEKLEDPNE